MSYGPNQTELYQRTAEIVDKILHGPRQPPSQRSTRARGARRVPNSAGAVEMAAETVWRRHDPAAAARGAARIGVTGPTCTSRRCAAASERLCGGSRRFAVGHWGERLTMALGRSVLRTDRLAPAAAVVDFWCCYKSRIGAEDAADDGVRRPRRGRG